MSDSSHIEKIKQLLEFVSSKRARLVIEHILEHGQVTTEDLKAMGYNHPPRAARDVREAGIPLETFRVLSSKGRSIAAYRFGDLNLIRAGRLHGRTTFPKPFKDKLYEISGGKCAICSGSFEKRYLQVDHRVPYEVSGDDQSASLATEDYMPLCSEHNRAKSWSCEHCENWLKDKLPLICRTCFWASPENYSHIALRQVRRVDILWDEEEISAFERLKLAAQQNGVPIPDYVKRIINGHLKK